MNEEYKCKDCKWLTGRKNIRGIECMNPVLQEKWNGAKNLWMGELRKDTARYKQRNAPACKKFEKESEDRVMSRYIKFDDAVKVMACEMYAEAQSQGYDADGIEDFMPEATAWLNDAPSIDIEPKRGEWIDMGDFEQCSVCKGTHLKEFQSYYGKTTWIKTPYCPNCGADMKGADDE